MLKQKIQVIGLVANYTVKKKKSGNLNIWQRNINRLKKKNRASNIYEVEVSEKRQGTEESKDLYSKNYKMLMKETEDDTN